MEGAAAVCYRNRLRAVLETLLGWSDGAAVRYRSWLAADLETLPLVGAAAVCYRCWLRADLETPLGWSWAAAVCYRSWLRADLETLSQWPLAENFAEMQRKGPEPDVITYSALINACARGD